MADLKGAADAFRKAEKLANGKTGHATAHRAGWLWHESGRWRDPTLHAQIVALYTQAHEAGEPGGFALFRRALEHMHTGAFDAAERDLEVLRSTGSQYAVGTLPVNLYLRMGNKDAAKKHLTEWNAVNKSLGRSTYKLADIEMGILPRPRG